jgi:DNA-binding transcriptional LysR family regulator
LTDFHRKYSNVQIIIKNATSSNLEGMMLKDEIDLAIMTLPIFSAEIKYSILFNEELLLAVSPENPLVKMSESLGENKYRYLDPNIIKDQTFIIFQPGTRLRDTPTFFSISYGITPNVVSFAPH